MATRGWGAAEMYARRGLSTIHQILFVALAATLVLGASAAFAVSHMPISSSSSTVSATTSSTGHSTISSTGTAINDTSGQLGPWNATTSYPVAALNPSCVTYQGYGYCIGGYGTNGSGSLVGEDLNRAYYASLSPSGVGAWMQTTGYPIGIQHESCVTTEGYIYCVGGYTNNQSATVTADVFYAPLSPSGIGSWEQGPSYPNPFANSCVADSGYVYCAGAEHESNGSFVDVGQSFFAAVLANGTLGNWSETTGSPTSTAGCTANGGYVYCFGGGNCAPPGPCTSPSYFAPLSSAGIGNWSVTTDLPTSGFAIFVAAGSNIFYFTTPVYSGPTSSSGIGQWETTTNYPETGPSACFSTTDYVYCIGGSNATGITADAYYAQVGVQNPYALHLQNPPPFQNAEYLVPSWSASGGCAVSSGATTEGGVCWGYNIDQAVIFQCLAAAATSSGCATTVVSPGYPQYNYELTIWYPARANSSLPETNCQLLDTFSSSSPMSAWCITVGPNSFIVSTPAPPIPILLGGHPA